MQSEQGLPIPALPDRYRVERRLARGGMATVYLATDLKHRRQVALKVLHPELSALLGTERFLQEIDIAAKLEHPHILPLLDSGEADGLLYYTMPFLAGASLRERLVSEKQLPLEDVTRIVTEVADALDHAHRRGIVHRDVKPENILLSDGHVRVADFGIARALASTAGPLTATGLALGTPAYMSPEQAAADRTADARSDIYALGCVCYELLAGEAPFTGPTAESILHQHLTADVPDVRTARPAVPEAVSRTVRRALAKTPADRFSTALAFARAISEAASGSPVERPQRLRRQTQILLGGVTLLAILGTSVIGWLLQDKTDSPPTVVRSHLSIAPDLDGGMWSLVMAFAPDGSRLVYQERIDGERHLYVRSLEDFTARRLAGTLDARGPFFSPDGQWLGYLQGEHLRIVRLSSGTAITVTSQLPSDVRATWGPGSTIYFSDSRTGLFAVEASAGASPRLIARGRFAWPEALPSGDVLAALAGTGAPQRPRELAVIRTGDPSVVDTLGVRGTRPRYVYPGYIVFASDDQELAAVPFDVRQRRLTGPSIRLASDLHSPQSFAVSRTALAYVRGRRERASLVSVSRDGRAIELDSRWRGDMRSLSLSPDGNRIAVSIIAQGQQHIWIKSSEAESAVRLTFDGADNRRPVWTPDGSGITYVAGNTVLTQSADGSRSPVLVYRDTIGLWEAMWSRDGRWLIVRVDGPGALEDLVAVRPGQPDSAVRLFSTPLVQEIHASLSPDGRYLAYASDESGEWEVYVRPFPAVSEGKWLVSNAGGSEPIWSRDGNTIYYRAFSNHMIAAGVDLVPSFSVVHRLTLFDTGPFRPGGFGRSYDVSTDGQRFVMIRDGEGEKTPEVVLVQNFMTELAADLSAQRK